MAEHKVVLSLKNISKHYPGVQALDNVSIDFREGEVHCLVGENGAGKSTLIKMISGADQPDSGIIEFNGKMYNAMTPKLSQELGIDVVYQEFNLAEDLSVAENLYIGQKIGDQKLFDLKELKARADKVFEEMEVDIDTTEIVRYLSVSYMQFVEIAKALSKNIKVLILDEPTAPLTEDEVQKLFNIVRKLKQQNYVVIYISHRLPELFEIGDRITILRDGKLITTGTIDQFDTPKLIKNMVGREMSYDYPKRQHEIGDIVFEAKHILSEKVHDISFSVRRGEILGIGGLVGAGRTELLRAIYGADLRYEGEIYLEGKKVKIDKPSDAVKLKIGFITEDRKREGLLLEDTICHNISLPILKKISKNGVVNKHEEKLIAEKESDELNIKAPSIETVAGSLSGGNQQKVVIAKWLAANCKVLFMDEPTRGVDVGAKQEIYKLLNYLASSGLAIVMISSEMEELMGMAERIIVLHEGKMAGEVQRQEFSQEKIMQYSSGIM